MGGPRSEVSLLEFDKTLGLAGHDRVFPDGYSQITDRLAEGTQVLPGHEVRQVDYSGARVDVLTNHASFQANQVLVTVPLRVLQAGRIGFDPSLPRAKHEALRKMRMGVFNKIFLKFDSVFWDEGYELIGYMGSQDDDWPESGASCAATPSSWGVSWDACERRMGKASRSRPAISSPAGIGILSASAPTRTCRSAPNRAAAGRSACRSRTGCSSLGKPPPSSSLPPSTARFLRGVRAAYEIMLPDAKDDLIKEGQGPAGTYV